MEASLFAVITGDVTGSSRIPANDRSNFLDHLKGLFQTIGDTWPGLLRTPFQIYRGDGFQAALSDPRLALRVALVIRSGLRSGYSTESRSILTDAEKAFSRPEGFLMDGAEAGEGGTRGMLRRM